MTEDPNAITAWLGAPPAGTGNDPYATNPAAEKLEATDFVAFAETVRHGGPAPKMFENGTRDVPSKTASGIDPHWISWLPAGVRHHAAGLATKLEVMALFEQVAGTPDARIEHPGLAAAEARLAAWSSTARAAAPARATAVAAQPKTQPRRQGASTRQRAMATVRTATHTADEMIALAQRGVFFGVVGQTPLEPKSRQAQTASTRGFDALASTT